MSKQAKEKPEEEEEEESVQAVRKTSSRVIVSDDEVDLEETIEDPSPTKSQVCACCFHCLFDLVFLFYGSAQVGKVPNSG